MTGAIDRSTITRGLALARLGIGAGIWLAPDLSMKVLGFDPLNSQVRALARLAGTRDLALGGLAAALAGDPDAERKVIALNALVDAGDALAFGISLRRREGINQAAIPGFVSASAAACVGAWLALRS